MQRIKTYYQSIDKIISFIAKWVGYIATLGIVIAGVSSLFSRFSVWWNNSFFVFLRQNSLTLWLSILSAIIVIIFFRISNLNQHFVGGFKDDIRNLDKWDFKGSWRIVENGILLITGSDEGGLTKVGTFWENYTFSFKARIINECIGVIVRAKDFYNYHMIQIRTDKIRPHYRDLLPIISELKEVKNNDGSIMSFQPVNYMINWQHDGTNKSSEFRAKTISPSLNGWFDVKITVKGQSITMWINNEIVFEHPSFLKIPTGKVGFRNSGAEEAYIKDVKVELLY